jgi:hypothetical protein
LVLPGNVEGLSKKGIGSPSSKGEKFNTIGA